MEPKIKLSLPARISSLRRRLDGILDRVWSFFVLSFSVVKTKFKKLANFITAKDDTGNRETASPKQVLVAVKAVSPKPSNQNTNESEKRGPSSWWRLVEVIGAIAVIVSAGIFYCQLQAQLDAMKIDQRAWISVKAVKLITPYSATSEGKIGIEIVNSGKTPALRTDIITASFGQTSDAKLHLVAPSIAMAIGPGIGDTTLLLYVPPSAPPAKAYLHFVIQYWDIFQKPSDRPHYTVFCGYYSPAAETPLFFSTADSIGCNAMN